MSWAPFVGALLTDLAAHSDLTGVQIAAYPVDEGGRNLEGIEVLGVTGGYEYHTMGPSTTDGFDVTLRLWCRAADDTSATGVATRTRFQTMLSAVDTVCRTAASTIYGQANRALVSRYEVTPRRGSDNSWSLDANLTVAVVDLPQ